MLTEQITSRHNPLIKRAQLIRRGGAPGHMFVEGARLVQEAIDSEVLVEALIFTSDFADSERGKDLLSRVMRDHCRGALVPGPIIKTVCDVETPQGIVALAAHPRYELADVFGTGVPLVVALDALQDPGNVGTIIRAAEAAGAAGVAATPGTAEPYGAKALRSAMGSAFRLPVTRRASLAKLAAEARSRRLTLYAASAGGSTPYTDVDWTLPSLLIVGNEGAGLSAEALALADSVVSIALAPPVESINAATAAAVILFEAARQRALQKVPSAEW